MFISVKQIFSMSTKNNYCLQAQVTDIKIYSGIHRKILFKKVKLNQFIKGY